MPFKMQNVVQGNASENFHKSSSPTLFVNGLGFIFYEPRNIHKIIFCCKNLLLPHTHPVYCGGAPNINRIMVINDND